VNTEEGAKVRPSQLRARIILTSLLATIAATSVAVAGSNASANHSRASAASKNFVLADAGGFTGFCAPYDLPALNGIRLAADQINAKGGLLGKYPIKIVSRDTHSDPVVTLTTTKELLSSIHPNFVFGACASDVNIPQAQAVRKAGIPFIGNNAEVALPKAVPGTFTSTIATNVEAGAVAAWARAHGYKRAYVLGSPDATFVLELAKYFKAGFTHDGGKVIGEDTFKVGAVDYSTQVTKIANLNPKPDVIYNGAFQPDSVTFMKQLRAAGVKTPVLFSDSQEAPATRTAGGKAMQGVVFPTHGLLKPGTPYAAFCKAYTKKYHKACDTVFIAIGGDIVKMIQAAVINAHSIDPAKVQKALVNLADVPAITSHITYRGTGGWPKKDVYFVKIVGDKLVPIGTEKANSFYIPPA
jgi:branched-chain amino acid transport system substrate-binding protein